ncbi:hypothetical protein EDC01DRAFT_629272 [Geopyxis carbonaria]|nr:hypothetical protein EDC01DRAFT_629272 [Geopyxis carbonaria]
MYANFTRHDPQGFKAALAEALALESPESPFSSVLCGSSAQGQMVTVKKASVIFHSNAVGNENLQGDSRSDHSQPQGINFGVVSSFSNPPTTTITPTTGFFARDPVAPNPFAKYEKRSAAPLPNPFAAAPSANPFLSRPATGNTTTDTYPDSWEVSGLVAALGKNVRTREWMAEKTEARRQRRLAKRARDAAAEKGTRGGGDVEMGGTKPLGAGAGVKKNKGKGKGKKRGGKKKGGGGEKGLVRSF